MDIALRLLLVILLIISVFSLDDNVISKDLYKVLGDCIL